MIRGSFMLLVAFMVSACGATALDTATRSTNTIGRLLEASDAVFAPQLAQALHDADAAHPDDDVAYKVQLAPIMRMHDALEAARDAERWLHLGIDQWAQDQGEMWREMLPCAAIALDHLANEVGNAQRLAIQVVLDQLVLALGKGPRTCRTAAVTP